jgi:hypothetical protein
MTGEGVNVARLEGHAVASYSASGLTGRDTTTQRDPGVRDNNNDSLNSLKMFLPRQPQPRGHEQPYEASGATPLERFMMPGDSNEPAYMRRHAMMQAQCYGDMGSVETRAHQAQVLAEKIVRDGQARKGSTRDGFIYK